jgi:hypothetical protein
VFRRYTTRTSEKSHVIRISAGGAAACKVCGAPYKTILRYANHPVRFHVLNNTFQNGRWNQTAPAGAGNKRPIHQPNCGHPARHRPNTFQHKVSLVFRQVNGHMRGCSIINPGSYSAIGDAPSENVNSLTVGRSSSCDVVLDYRTVSTVHARVSIEGYVKAQL